MSTPQEIVLATNFSTASVAAASVAGRIARILRAKVTILHVFRYPSKHPYRVRPEWMFEVTRRHIMRHLARTQDKLRRWRVTSEVRIEEDGEAAHKILDYVRSREHPLLVMGTHAVASMERFLLGSVAEGVFRQAPCPVITVGPLAQTESDLDVGFEKLLFATDFNDTSIAAVPLIQTLQEPCKAGLRVLHVTSKDFSRNEEEDNQFDPVRVALGGTEKREFVTLHGDDISQAVVNEAERYPADLLIRVFGEPRPGRHI